MCWSLNLSSGAATLSSSVLSSSSWWRRPRWWCFLCRWWWCPCTKSKPNLSQAKLSLRIFNSNHDMSLTISNFSITHRQQKHKPLQSHVDDASVFREFKNIKNVRVLNGRLHCFDRTSERCLDKRSVAEKIEKTRADKIPTLASAHFLRSNFTSCFKCTQICILGEHFGSWKMLKGGHVMQWILFRSRKKAAVGRGAQGILSLGQVPRSHQKKTSKTQRIDKDSTKDIYRSLLMTWSILVLTSEDIGGL